MVRISCDAVNYDLGFTAVSAQKYRLRGDYEKVQGEFVGLLPDGDLTTLIEGACFRNHPGITDREICAIAEEVQKRNLVGVLIEDYVQNSRQG